MTKVRLELFINKITEPCPNVIKVNICRKTTLSVQTRSICWPSILRRRKFENVTRNASWKAWGYLLIELFKTKCVECRTSRNLLRVNQFYCSELSTRDRVDEEPANLLIPRANTNWRENEKVNYKPLLNLSFYVVFVGEKSGNFEKEMSKAWQTVFRNCSRDNSQLGYVSIKRFYRLWGVHLFHLRLQCK